jgi:hypothetical protein
MAAVLPVATLESWSRSCCHKRASRLEMVSQTLFTMLLGLGALLGFCDQQRDLLVQTKQKHTCMLILRCRRSNVC